MCTLFDLFWVLTLYFQELLELMHIGEREFILYGAFFFANVL